MSSLIPFKDSLGSRPPIRRIRRAVWLMLTLLCAQSSASSVFGQTLSLSVEPSGAAVTGLAAGGSAVLFGVQRQREGWLHRVVTVLEQEADQNGDAAVDFALDSSSVTASLLFAVDLGTGERGVASPEGSADIGVPATITTPWLSVSRQGLELPFASATVLWVRPGVGTWTGRFVDGGPGDLGTESDGSLLVALDSLAVVGGSGGPMASSPSALAPNDLVIAIDPRSLDHALAVSPQS